MADHPRSNSSEQQEADSKGCGMFDFLKKKPEDHVTDENIKKEEKPQRLHHSSDTSSSDEEEVDEIGEKKKMKKGLKEKVFGHKEKDIEDHQYVYDDKKDDVVTEKIILKVPAAKGTHDQQANKLEDVKEKGFMEKMKEKLPSAGGHDQQTNKLEHHEDGKEKGFMEKIKEKMKET